MNESEAKAVIAQNVSRETMQKLDIFVATLLHWSRRINLVAPSTRTQCWSRHVLDSAQLYALWAGKEAVRSKTRTWLDFGSGAGFPALVLAILFHEQAETACDRMICVESNSKKAGFLRHVVRETGIQVQVHNQRIEQLEDIPADIITARALASLDKLCGFSERFCQKDTVLLFPKGKGRKKEIQTARRNWQFVHEDFPSQTDELAGILRITCLQKG